MLFVSFRADFLRTMNNDLDKLNKIKGISRFFFSFLALSGSVSFGIGFVRIVTLVVVKPLHPPISRVKK